MSTVVSPDELSIIVTTSPIRSHPDTQVIDDSINSILMQPSLKLVHIFIICDGAKVTEQNKYKSGIITQQTLQNYGKYKAKLHEKYSSIEKYTIIERQQRHGFADNIKFVMQTYVKTDYVMIYQHDHIIEDIIDFPAVMDTMKNFKQINYVTFMHKSYRTIIARLVNEVNVKKYVAHLIGKEESYNVTRNIDQFSKDLIKYFDKLYGLPLVPLNFWYDKVHIASKKFYLDVVFSEKGNFDPNRGRLMKTISFPEDTFGHCMKNSINKEPELLMHYGAYILWNQKQVFYHNSGRAFINEQQRKQYLKKGKQKGSEKKQKQKEEEEQSEQQKLSLKLEELMIEQ